MGVQEVNTKKSEIRRWKKPNFFATTQVLLLPKRIKNCDVGSTYLFTIQIGKTQT